MSMVDPTITVIIPYYQRSTEPLRNAIQSILLQDSVDRPHILIVDDGSPLPARGIIEADFRDERDNIQVIQQGNAGAAKARNTGLGNLPAETRYVAFMDSDDEWSPQHLHNAISLLSRGYDFYFAGHQRGEWAQDKYAMLGFDFDRHVLLDAERRLYEFSGDALLPIMRDHLVQTSTVVYRLEAMRDLRFPVDLTIGEDEIFWARAVLQSRRIGFCARTEAFMGRGVNISQGGNWADNRSFQLLAQNMEYWRRIPEFLPTTPELEVFRNGRIRQLRLALASSILHRLKRGKGVPLRHIARFTSADPFWFWSLGTVLVRYLTGQR